MSFLSFLCFFLPLCLMKVLCACLNVGKSLEKGLLVGSFSALLGFQFSSVAQSCRLFATPWIAARQASLSITNSWSPLKLTSIESVMPSSHLILGHPLLLLPPTPPSIRVFFNVPTLRMRWPKYWSFSFSITPSKEHPELISFRTVASIPGYNAHLYQMCSEKRRSLLSICLF